MRERHFEDFRVGEKFTTGEVTLSEEDILDFARRWDPQPFHVDPRAAEASPYGGLIASGFQTVLTSFRLFIDSGVFGTTGMGSPGMDSIRWLRPVRPGDTLKVETEVLEARPSNSDPARGIVVMNFETTNQRGETVLTMRAVHLVRRRGGGPA